MKYDRAFVFYDGLVQVELDNKRIFVDKWGRECSFKLVLFESLIISNYLT